MKIFVLIPTRNRKELTLLCLKSLYNQTFTNSEIVIVDDGSTDGTREEIGKKYPHVTVLEGDGNLWWTGAMRLGIEYILSKAKAADYVLIQNDDTYMDKNYLNDLLLMVETGPSLILGTSVKDYNTKELIYNSHRVSKLSLKPVIVNDKNDLIDTFTLSGRGVFVPIKAFKDLGNFSKGFPHYGADYDFFCRAKKKGYTLKVSSKVITYSTNNKPNLSKRVKSKDRVSLKDLYDLFFVRRSSNNIFSSLKITLVHVPFPLNILGAIKYLLFVCKMFVVDFMLNNIKHIFNK